MANGTEQPRQSGSGSTSPSSTAPADAEAAVLAAGQAYAAAVNRSDKQAATALTCEKSSPGAMYEAGAGKAQYKVGPVKVLNSTTATVDMITVGASGRGVPLPFYFRDTWCVGV